MTAVYLDRPTGTLAEIARVAFPSYTGRRFKVQATESLNVKSWWE